MSIRSRQRCLKNCWSIFPSVKHSLFVSKLDKPASCIRCSSCCKEACEASSFRKLSLTLAHTLRVQPVTADNTWQQEYEAAAHCSYRAHLSFQSRIPAPGMRLPTKVVYCYMNWLTLGKSSAMPNMYVFCGSSKSGWQSRLTTMEQWKGRQIPAKLILFHVHLQ